MKIPEGFVLLDDNEQIEPYHLQTIRYGNAGSYYIDNKFLHKVNDNVVGFSKTQLLTLGRIGPARFYLKTTIDYPQFPGWTAMGLNGQFRSTDVCVIIKDGYHDKTLEPGQYRTPSTGWHIPKVCVGMEIKAKMCFHPEFWCVYRNWKNNATMPTPADGPSSAPSRSRSEGNINYGKPLPLP